jgi:photosystem II stability/assembly factor-like uncharacterized protein
MQPPSRPRGARRPSTFVLIVVSVVSFVLGIAPGARAARVVENLYGADLIDETTGFVVGAFGAVFRTADGGLTWTRQATPTDEYLFGVDFFSPERGAAVGKAGTVLTTDDGGKTWTKRSSGTDRNLFSVSYVTPDRLWAIGDWGAVIESHDGGATWKDRTLSEDVVLTSQSWPDASHGFLAGEFGSVYKTEDGGESWVKVATGTEKTLFGVAFVTPTDGWAVGIDGLMLRTKDGGVTWEVQRGSLEGESLEALGFMEALRNPGLYDVEFAGDYGYVVGDVGMLLVSSDRGETWTERKLPAEMSLFWLRGASVTAGGRALLVGASGLIAFAEKDRVKLNQSGG